MPFNVGENVGPYRIIEQLGQGGMATVFKSYHASLDRYVAIKALHPAFNRMLTLRPVFSVRRGWLQNLNTRISSLYMIMLNMKNAHIL